MEESVIKRVQPHSIEAEQAVLGAMLMDQEAVVKAAEILNPQDFYARQYGVLFEAMVELNNEGKPVDLITLQNRLKEKDVPPEISSLEFIKDIIGSVETSVNAEQHAKIIADKALLRKIIKANEEIANTCYAGKESVDTILESTEKQIFDLVQSRGSSDFVPINQIVINALERIEASAKTKGNVTGHATGFLDLDYKTAGMQPSDLSQMRCYF